ncbi:hypothetical protein OQA88_616 [Cercophora sp. LCS_1]
MQPALLVCLLHILGALALAAIPEVESPPTQDANLNVHQVEDLTSSVSGTPMPSATSAPPQATFRPPGACSNILYKTPVYEFGNVHAEVTFRANGSTQAPYYHANFTVWDAANRLALFCDWGVLYWSSYQDDGYSRDACRYVGTDYKGDFEQQMHLQVQLFGVEDTGGRVIRLVQYWYCTQGNGSYPLLIQSKAEAEIVVSCPSSGDRDGPYACNVTTPLPVTANTTWTPPTLPPENQRLVPRPSPSPQAANTGISPPPAEDCTSASFTHPDWTLTDAAYTSYFKGATPGESSLNFTLASSATGAQISCGWEGTMKDRTFYGDKGLMVLACSGVETPARSNDSVVPTYEWEKRILTIYHDWRCGDAQGSYSTNFSAYQSLTVPWYCVENNGKLCRSNPLTIRGQLTAPARIYQPELPPPPALPSNMSVAGCTARSGGPGWQIAKFWFNQTRLTELRGADRDRLTRNSLQRRVMEVELRNVANNYVTSCTITSDKVNDGVGGWSRCELEAAGAGGGYRIETFIQFNHSYTGRSTFSWNQTWYCSDTDPSVPLVFSATAAAVPFCGWTNTTIEDACTVVPPANPFPPSAQCTHTYSTRWCAVGIYEPGSGAIRNPYRIHTGTLTSTSQIPLANLTAPTTDINTNSCTIASLARGPVTWRLKQQPSTPLLTTAWPSSKDPRSAETKFRALLESSALPGKVTTLRAISFGDSDDEMTPWLPFWQPAYVYPRHGLPEGVTNFTMRFDATTGYAEMGMGWVCGDRSPGRP